MTKVINFVAGPSAGKSTKALELTAFLKKQRQNVEYAHEFCKDLVWDKNFNGLNDQLHILGKQHHKLWRLQGQVDYVITDSPLIIQLYYVHQMKFGSIHEDLVYRWIQTFNNMVIRTAQLYDNIYFFVERGDRKYIKEGRTSSEERAIQIDKVLKNILMHYCIPYTTILHDDPIDDIALLICKKGP